MCSRTLERREYHSYSPGARLLGRGVCLCWAGRRHLWTCGVRVVPDLCLKPSVMMPVEIHEGKSYGLQRDAHKDSKWSRRYNGQHRLWGLTTAMGNALRPHLQTEAIIFCVQVVVRAQ